MFPPPCGVWVVSGKTAPRRRVKCFRPLAGCELFLLNSSKSTTFSGFRPLAGCEFFRQKVFMYASAKLSPSPCGEKVVSTKYLMERKLNNGFRPLAGCRLFLLQARRLALGGVVSVPLRGVGCFLMSNRGNGWKLTFPSPCGVWVGSDALRPNLLHAGVSVPLWGVGRFLLKSKLFRQPRCFRPLAGCELFPADDSPV